MGSKLDNVQGRDPRSNKLKKKREKENHVCWVEQVGVNPLLG